MSIYKEEFYNNGNSNWNDKIETSNNFIEAKSFSNFDQEKTKNDKITTNFFVNNFTNRFSAKTSNMCDLNESVKMAENSSLIKFESDKICSNNSNENNNLDFTTLHSNQEIALSDQILKNQQTENCNQVVNQNFVTHPSTSINKSINMPLTKNSKDLSKPQLTVDTQLSSNNVDDGLTNLSWLQNLNMGMTRLGAPTPPASPLCNLTPSYFSVISPLSNSSNNNLSCNQSTQISLKQNKLTDNNSRKFSKNKSSSRNSSKTKQGVKKNSSKVNNINQNFNSNFNQNNLNQNSQTNCNLNEIIDNSQNNLYNQTNNSKTNLVSNNSLDYIDLNNSLDLLYNGDHSMLNPDFCSTLCNEEDVNLTNLNNSNNISNPSFSNTNSKQKLLLNNELSLKNVNNNYAENSNYLDEQIDYKLNGSIKPPYSYATLICMAMEKNSKMTLRAIYKWIKENFLYYRNADPSWQNSIRHNLSLNKCFIKIARTKEEPGKGGFWKLDPVYAENFTNGVFKKRKHPQSKNELDLLLNEVPEKKKKKKETKQKKLSSFNPQTVDYSNLQNKSIYHSGDNIVMHDTPPNSAESYSGFVEGQTDIETTNAINSLELANRNNLNQMQNNSMHQPQHTQQTSYNDLNDLSSAILKEKPNSNSSQHIISNCNLSSSSNQQTIPIHHFRNLENHLNNNPQNSSHHQSLNAQSIQHHHQSIINQQQKSPVTQNQHYMIHVTNTNNQESQITIEPMSNVVQQIESASNCTFTNEIQQLTNLNSNNEPCLESSSLSLSTMNNNVQENCLLTNDTDICWNALLTDDIRLVDSISTYNVANSSIQVANSNNYQVNNSIVDSQQAVNLVTENSNSISLNHSNLILNQIPTSQQINNTNPTYFNSANSLENFTNHQIVTNCNGNLDNSQLNAPLNNSQMISANQNVVTCTDSSNNVVTTNLTQTTSWDNGRNWMTYNHINNQNANNTANNETSNNDLSNVNLSAHDRNCNIPTNTNDNQNVVIQINSNNNCLSNEIQNCNSFYNTNIMPTWIECKVAFESNSFDLDNFSDLDSCSKY